MINLEISPSWNKKLSMKSFMDLSLAVIRQGSKILDEVNWEKNGEDFVGEIIHFNWIKGIDLQTEIMVWIDDNIEGYFYAEVFQTEGGTPIVRDGDLIKMKIYFQKESDAQKFREIANDNIASKILWGKNG